MHKVTSLPNRRDCDCKNSPISAPQSNARVVSRLCSWGSEVGAPVAVKGRKVGVLPAQKAMLELYLDYAGAGGSSRRGRWVDRRRSSEGSETSTFPSFYLPCRVSWEAEFLAEFLDGGEREVQEQEERCVRYEFKINGWTHLLLYLLHTDVEQREALSPGQILLAMYLGFQLTYGATNYTVRKKKSYDHFWMKETILGYL